MQYKIIRLQAHNEHTISSASQPAASSVSRMRGMSLVTPVAVSLCTTATALIFLPVSACTRQADAQLKCCSPLCAPR